MTKKGRVSRSNIAPPARQSLAHNSLGQTLFVCCCLFAATALVFAQTIRFGFVNYDDDVYVYQNPAVRNGFTGAAIQWAFTHVYAANWHPLTWLSHMLDFLLWGIAPAGHHATNVALHSFNAVLLFLVLRNISGAMWRSAFVAALFALHPLRVESVAWVAERKDVLSGFFFFLTIAAYWHYCRGRSVIRYVLVAVALALGVMAKPSLVPTPIVLLLLDYWPVQRLPPKHPARRDIRSSSTFWQLAIEKAPLLVISAASGAATLFAQKFSVTVGGGLPVWARVANALVSYAVYLRQMVWPSGLAVLYPHPGTNIPIWQVAFAVLVLAGISAAVVRFAKRSPYLLTGWLWYLVMLLPAIGLVQVGFQSHADRYTYLSQIGLYIIIAWGVRDALSAFAWRRVVMTSTAIVVLILLACLTAHQCSYWRDSEALWTRALNVTRRNAVAHNNLGNLYLDRNQFEQARTQYEASLRISSPVAEQTTELGLMERAYADAENNLGLVLVKTGHQAEGMQCYQNVLTRFRDNPKAHLNIGNVLLDANRVDDAITHYRRALVVYPQYVDAHFNLGNAFAQKGQIDEAIREYQQALVLQPDLEEARNNLAIAFLKQGAIAKAVSEWSSAAATWPNSTEILNNLAWVLATYPDASVRDGTKAVNFAQRAASLSQAADPAILRTLAAAYAESGKFAEASQAAERAISIAGSQNSFSLVEVLQQELDRYQRRQTVRTAAELGVDRIP